VGWGNDDDTSDFDDEFKLLEQLRLVFCAGAETSDLDLAVCFEIVVIVVTSLGKEADRSGTLS